MMIGFAENEWRFVGGFSEPYLSMDRPTAERLFAAVVGAERAPAFYDAYAQWLGAEATPSNVAHQFMSFEQFKLGTWDLARRVTGRGAPIYVYQFSWRVPGLDGRMGAPHGADIPFIFDNWHIWSGAVPMMEGATPETTRSLTDAMQGAWVAFARSGDPNHSRLPHWPVFGINGHAIRFDRESRAVDDLLAPEADLWARAGVHRLADLDARMRRAPPMPSPSAQ